MFGAWPHSKLPDACAAFVIPPSQKEFLVNAIVRHRMMNDRGRLITQPLSRCQHAGAKLRIFVANLASRTRPQFRKKIAIPFKNRLAESHVGAKGRFEKLSGLVPKIELNQRTGGVPGLGVEPARNGAKPLRNHTAARTRPF